MTSDVLRTPRTASALLAESRRRVEPARRVATARLPALIRGIAGYHVDWWDTEHPGIRSRGRSVRPAFVLASATAVAAPAADAITEAVAVELVHGFALLHDDITDGAPGRRGRSTIGIPETALTGDTLQSLAHTLLAGRPSLPVLADATLRLCLAHAHLMAVQQRIDVSVAECLAIAEGRTAALFSGACAMGAMAGGAEPPVCRLLSEFGHEVGLAVALIDDLLGIWGDPKLTGRPAYSDLAARRKTLPVVAALNSRTPAGRQLARHYRHRPTDAPGAEHELAELVEAAGGRRWAETEADRRLELALSRLSGHSLRDTDLRTLAHALVHRDRT